MTLKIEIQTAELDRALTRLASAVGDMTPIMRAIGGELEAATERNVDSDGARIASRWKPSQRAIEQNGQTLRDTGRLVSSISAGGAGHIKEYTKDSVFVGTNVAYAAIHQFGGKAGRNRKVTIPARPFFGLNAEDEQDIAELISKMLDKAMQ